MKVKPSDSPAWEMFMRHALPLQLIKNIFKKPASRGSGNEQSPW